MPPSAGRENSACCSYRLRRSAKRQGFISAGMPANVGVESNQRRPITHPGEAAIG
jgi:hypothetical protein